MSYWNYSGNNWRWYFIEELVNKHGWTKGAELGTWRGATFLYLLEHCPSLTMLTVDLWAPQDKEDNKETGDESYAKWDHVAFEKLVRDQSVKYGDRAIIIKDWTHEAAKQVEDESLDFVFIDADHTAEGVRRDIQDWRPKLKPNGWLLGHDIDWDSVRQVVEEECPGYITGQNYCWGRKK